MKAIGWTCPDCGRLFRIANQWHSCGRFTEEGYLEGKSARALSVYEAVREAVLALGPCRVSPVKTRVGFKGRMTFAAVTLKKGGARVGFALPREASSPRFVKSEQFGDLGYHFVDIADPGDVDEELRGWLAEAYAYGAADL